MILIGKILYAVAKWFWPDLQQWEDECRRACRGAGAAAAKLDASIYRHEIEPRAEYETLIAGMGTLNKLMRGPHRAFLPTAWRDLPPAPDSQKGGEAHNITTDGDGDGQSWPVCSCGETGPESNKRDEGESHEWVCPRSPPAPTSQKGGEDAR